MHKYVHGVQKAKELKGSPTKATKSNFYSVFFFLNANLLDNKHFVAQEVHERTSTKGGQRDHHNKNKHKSH
jgi:hypothetical protein